MQNVRTTSAFLRTELKGVTIMARLTKYEKETILRTSKGDKEYSIFSFDQALQRKLDKFAKEYPDLCKLKFATKEGSKSYEIEKTRVSIRLMVPWSEERKKNASKYAEENGLIRNVTE